MDSGLILPILSYGLGFDAEFRHRPAEAYSSDRQTIANSAEAMRN